MEKILTVLAANIQQYRKRSQLTQETLAEKLGVTFQAVSKWETAKCAPDIVLLPVMADLFNCSIDALFSHDFSPALSCHLPWSDDGILRGVVFEGTTLLCKSDGITDRFTFEVQGEVKNGVRSECSIAVDGNVSGGCNANDCIAVKGNVSGSCHAGDSIAVVGNVSGGCNAGDGVSVGGNLSGNVNCGDSVNVDGDVECERIRGNVACRKLVCDNIDGDITITT